MRKRIRVLCLVLLLACPLLLGAQVAPLVPTTDYFVNDHAGVIYREHRERLLDLAVELEEQTGAQLVVLTVKGTDDLSVDEYADAIFHGWGIGGFEQYGALIFVASEDGDCRIVIGEGLQEIVTPAQVSNILSENMATYLDGGNLSVAVTEGFRALAAGIYEARGIEAPDLSFEEVSSTATPFSPVTMVILAMIVFVTARSMRVTRRYNKKYGHRSYQRKDFVREDLPDEDDRPYRSRFTTRQDEIDRLKREALLDLADQEREEKEARKAQEAAEQAAAGERAAPESTEEEK